MTDKELIDKLFLEKEQYKAISNKQDELIKEAIKTIDKLKAENTALKSKMTLALSMMHEIYAKLERRSEIDFPNSKKGGQGDSGTPSIFPEDSNIF